MKIAITTPTGKIGRQLVKGLLDRGGHDLILLARDSSKLEEERVRGARVAQGDLSDAAFVREATQNVDALFWVTPPDLSAPDYLGYQKVIIANGAKAVRENAIPHVVLLSSIGGHLESGTGPIRGLHLAEEEFRKGAPNLTILRPTYFMENFLGSVEALREARGLFLPVPAELRFPMIATQDIAAAAARALTQEDTTGVRVWPLHGPRDYSFAEVAEAFGKAVGQEIRYVQIDRAQARESMLKIGASENASDTMLELYAAMLSGHLKAEYPRSEETTTPTTIEEFARDVLAPAVHGVAALR